jgi:hypothetical protein
MLIGGSIQEAIDWTQDRLATTRPLAESTLFSLIASKQVKETATGFVLAEADGEDEMRKRHSAAKVKGSRGNRPRFRFHQARKHAMHLKHYVQNFERDRDDDKTEDAKEPE